MYSRSDNFCQREPRRNPWITDLFSWFFRQSDFHSRARGVGRAEAPSGEGGRAPQLSPKQGRLDLVGVHYSREARTAVTGAAFGTGMKGAEAERVRAARSRSSLRASPEASGTTPAAAYAREPRAVVLARCGIRFARDLVASAVLWATGILVRIGEPSAGVLYPPGKWQFRQMRTSPSAVLCVSQAARPARILPYARNARYSPFPLFTVNRGIPHPTGAGTPRAANGCRIKQAPPRRP